MPHNDPSMFVPILLVAIIAASYLVLALRQQAGPRGWASWKLRSS